MTAELTSRLRALDAAARAEGPDVSGRYKAERELGELLSGGALAALLNLVEAAREMGARWEKWADEVQPDRIKRWPLEVGADRLAAALLALGEQRPTTSSEATSEEVARSAGDS